MKIHPANYFTIISLLLWPAQRAQAQDSRAEAPGFFILDVPDGDKLNSKNGTTFNFPLLVEKSDSETIEELGEPVIPEFEESFATLSPELTLTKAQQEQPEMSASREKTESKPEVASLGDVIRESIIAGSFFIASLSLALVAICLTQFLRIWARNPIIRLVSETGSHFDEVSAPEEELTEETYGEEIGQSRVANTSDESKGALPEIPKLFLAPELLPRIEAAFIDFFNRKGWENEWAIVLVGRIRNKKEWEAVSFIDAGPNASYSPGHIRVDQPYVDQQLAGMRLLDSSLGILGNLHRHPGQMDHPSSGDLSTDRESAKASRSRGMFYAIATLDHPKRSDAQSHYTKRFKIDFRFLGKATDWQYQRVLPVEDKAAEFVTRFPEHGSFLEHRPGAVLDFALLPLVAPSLRVTLTQAETAGGKQFIFRARDPRLGEFIIVDPGNDSDSIQVIQKSRDGSLFETSGPWQKANGSSRHFFYSEIIRLLVEQQK